MLKDISTAFALLKGKMPTSIAVLSTLIVTAIIEVIAIADFALAVALPIWIGSFFLNYSFHWIYALFGGSCLWVIDLLLSKLKPKKEVRFLSCKGE